jgi:RNA polymerase-binding transcription factor DksA
MTGMNYAPYQQKLTRRRRDVARTLEYVRTELAAVDKNRKLIDGAAYKSRCELLDGLVAWYLDEASRIDQALARIREGNYGICFRCSQSIDPLQLEGEPWSLFLCRLPTSRCRHTTLTEATSRRSSESNLQ